MKIVLIGAGSYVFGPTVLIDAIERHKISGELALVDLDVDNAQRMARVGQRMADIVGAECTVTATGDRREVLAGADYVILSAAPQGFSRWMMDYDILKDAGMLDQSRECGGLGGLSYTLRTISLTLDVCADMRELCPHAVLLDVTNPMPRVVSAARRFGGVETFGFCNAAQQGEADYDWLGRVVQRDPATLDIVTAGLNHFAWLVSIKDRNSGEDLYDVVASSVGNGDYGPLLQRWLKTYGGIGASGPSHMGEYLPTDPDATYSTKPPYHGDAEERAQRKRDLDAIAAGEKDWHTVFTNGSWEHPVDVAVARESGEALHVPMINLPNAGYLSDLPESRIVEVPAVITNGQIAGVKIGKLPGHIGELCASVDAVNYLVAEGAATGNVDLLKQAIAIDPAVSDKAGALPVLDAFLKAHADILPRFK